MEEEDEGEEDEDDEDEVEEDDSHDSEDHAPRLLSVSTDAMTTSQVPSLRFPAANCRSAASAPAAPFPATAATSVTTSAADSPVLLTASSVRNVCPCASRPVTSACRAVYDLPWDDPVSHHAFLPLASSVLQQMWHHLAPAQFGAWFAALQRSSPSTRALQLDDDASLDLVLHAATKWGIHGDAEMRTVREIKSHFHSFLKRPFS